MVDDAQLLMLPLELCRDVRMIGGTALTTKLLMIMEAARVPRQASVSLPVWQLAEAMGTKGEYVRQAVRKLPEVGCATRSPDDGVWETFGIVEPDGATADLGRGATVTLRMTPEWRESCDGRREVPVPLDEVRSMTTRSGLLTRMRVGAMLHGREVPSDPRVRIPADSIPDYTGYDGNGGRSMAVEKLLVPGILDLNEHSSTVRVAMDTRCRAGTSEHPWLLHVELRVTPLRRHARSWHVLRDAAEAVR